MKDQIKRVTTGNFYRLTAGLRDGAELFNNDRISNKNTGDLVFNLYPPV